MWTDFYNWNNFYNTFLKAKIKAIKKHQLFASCSRNDGTIECQLSGLTNNVTYDDDLLKPTMTVQAQCIALLLKPKELYKKSLGLRDIKVVGLRENYAILIGKKYHKDMCPMPLFKVWIKVKNYYPIGTKIERESKKDPGYVYDAIVTAFDLKTK